MRKRFLSLFMSLVLCVSLLPVSVSAEDDNTTEAVGETITAVNETEEKDENGTEETPVPDTEENDDGGEAVPEPNSAVSGEAVSLTVAHEPVEYIDKDGNRAVCENYIVLDGDPDGNILDGTAGEAWYVISGKFNATENWVVEGSVNLILTDDSLCNTDGHYIDLKDKAELTVYGQAEGTGTLSVYHTPAVGTKDSALGGPSPLIEDKNMHWHTELGSFALYGGNVNLESTGYDAADLAGLTVMGGTFTAKTVKSCNTMSLHGNEPTLAENYKICKADEPQEKSEYSNTNGKKILITECTQHIWTHYPSETKGMRKLACYLCSVFREEPHEFNLFGGESDNMKHNLKCVCGAVSESKEYHTLVYTPNSDTLTHRYGCKVCDYEDTNNSGEHDFTKNRTLCADCGFKRGTSLKTEDTLKNFTRLTDAIETAGYSDKNGIITLYGGEECFPGNRINIIKGNFAIDFVDAELSFPGLCLFNVHSNADVTLRNGKINLSGDTDNNDNPGILVESGSLTLENLR